ncbi:Uma2 family endonuclease [Streptomyces sp. NPDC050625]|uniref:Uma2 family endonuclease n=1 Tax=Streptomyces sp. NPDC050625 TaxID=3154629 RepID=UPI00343D0827
MERGGCVAGRRASIVIGRRLPQGARDTNRRDRIDKVRGYAEAGIPIHLLIDRDNNTLVVHSEPKDGRYQQSPAHSWGATVAPTGNARGRHPQPEAGRAALGP